MTVKITSEADATEGLFEFVRIVEEGSVSAAARSLGVPRASLSRRLSGLEKRLGVRLLHRTTRTQSLSHAGDELYSRARRIVSAAREAEEVVRRVDDIPRGLLRVSLPPSLGRDSSMTERLILEFMDRYPEVSIEVICTSRHVDLIGEGIDVALRAGEVRDPSLFAKRLWRNRAFAVASSDYLARRGSPETALELAQHDCLLGFEAGERPERSWPTLAGGSVPVQGRLAVNDLTVRLSAVLQGYGIALLPEMFVQSQVEAGHLVLVLPDVIGISSGVALVYPERDFLDPKVRAFVDHASAVIEEVRSELIALANRPHPPDGRA